MLKEILVSVQKENRSSAKKVTHFWEDTYYEETIGRAMNVKGDSGEVPDGKVGHVIGN